MLNDKKGFVKINKHFVNQNQCSFWKDGFISIPIEPDVEKKSLIIALNELYKNYLTSNKFSIREKYLNFEQYDFSGNIEELEFCTKFLKQTNIIEIINFITCNNLILVNIRVRINRNLKDSGFWGEHRDTSILKNNSIKGLVPPAKILIYYPNLDDAEPENQLKIWVGSHKKIFKSFFDKFINFFSKKIIIKTNSDSMILFDGSIKHAIGNTKNLKGNLRLIFTFIDKNQIHDNIEDRNNVEKWHKYLSDN
jgi:hypothetical protein